MIRIIELFAGIGACSKAITRLGIEHDIVDAVEIDKYAIKSFNAIHNTNFETQDITTWDKEIKDVDLIMHGSPCQDFSIAGKQAGGDVDSGTRSSLMYETVRIVGKIRPKYIVWENVKNILSAKHKHNFEKYIDTLNTLGYNSYYQVLNAKDYGIPQNRERIFTISIRKDIDSKNFSFPEKQELKLRLKDILDNVVEDKYYLSDEITQRIKYKFGNKENVLLGGMQEIKQDGICTTLTCSMGTGGGYIPMVARKYGVFDNENAKHQAGSVYDEKGIAPTIDTMQGGWRQPCIEIRETTNIGLRIRKLTPKECWRLMGLDDDDFEKAATVNSNTQLYKQAGNSIVVNVLEKIFKNLFKEELNETDR